MLGLGRERGSDLMGTARGSVFIIGFFFTGCAPDDGILVLKGFKGDLHEWSKMKAICKYFYFIFLKKLNTTEIGAKREVNLYGIFLI